MIVGETMTYTGPAPWRMLRAGGSVFLLIVLTACANPKAQTLIGSEIVAATPAAIAGEHRIFVATTRAASDDPREVFDGNRSLALSFATTDVTVPGIHKTGVVERPKNGVRDPSRYFTASSVARYPTSEAFVRELRQSIEANGGRALVFIHGYNTRFDDAVYRLTQLVHDAGYDGPAVLFTWASAGRTVDYIYDRDSATVARDGLERTLRLVEEAGASRIDVIAHSMGTWVTLEALRQLAITGDRDIDGKLGDVILASPDVDVDVFKSQMKRYGMPDRPFFLMLSRNDRALNISGIIAGNRPRLGEYTKDAEIAGYGVVVVDVTALEAGDATNHTKFADNPVLVRLLGERLRQGDRLTETRGNFAERLNNLATGLGQTAASAADIVITTPVEVIGTVARP
jgi:esterase/lipase superfamily enzyme